jgi:hypothetical protein
LPMASGGARIGEPRRGTRCAIFDIRLYAALTLGTLAFTRALCP